MELTVNVDIFTVILLLFIVNEVLTHLQNWWHRKIDNINNPNVVLLFLLTYTSKMFIIIILLGRLLK